VHRIAAQHHVNLRSLDTKHVGVSLDEATTVSEIEALLKIFHGGNAVAFDVMSVADAFWTRSMARFIEPLDALRAGSIDPYASLRSAYRQRRAAEIRNPAAAGDPAARGTGFGVGAGAQGTGPS
jgi:ABC-type transporter lipoprotein component MlaA